MRAAPDKEIYLAHHRALGFQVTIDIFSDNSLIMPNGLTVSAWEASVLGKLDSHQNIAKVHDYWEEDGRAIMVSRYFSGGSLSDRIADAQGSGTGLPVESILRISLEIAHGLAYIHGQRILYRDLQPCNVLFDEWDTVHLVDFDTAVSLDDGGMRDLSHRAVIEYMAPELLTSEDADERADLYSLGATVYAMVAGHPPFRGDRAEIATALRTGPPALKRDELPYALRELIFCLLAADRYQRPPSAADVIKRLEDLRATRDELEQLLVRDESTTLEFKATLRTPIDPPKPDDNRSPKELKRVLEREVLETMAGFLNTDGGTLVIGVKDDRTIVGIEADYPRVKGSSDGWCNSFDQLVSNELGTDVMKCIDLQLESIDQGHTIAVIRCEQRDEPTWLQDELFVRRTTSTVKLSARQAVAWLHQRSG
jgi:serine/threonine protein kinase